MRIPSMLFGALLCWAGLFLPGCAYTQKAALPSGIKSIYIDTVKNKIPVDEIYAYVPGLEIAISNAIVRRLNEDGNLQVAGSKEKADAVLETDLRKIEQEGLRFTSLEAVEEYRLFLVVSARLRNARTGEMIWEEHNFSGDAEYFVTGVRSTGREEAAERAIVQLARNLVDRIVEDW